MPLGIWLFMNESERGVNENEWGVNENERDGKLGISCPHVRVYIIRSRKKVEGFMFCVLCCHAVGWR